MELIHGRKVVVKVTKKKDWIIYLHLFWRPFRLLTVMQFNVIHFQIT